MSEYIQNNTDNASSLTLQGEWTIAHVGDIKRALKRQEIVRETGEVAADAGNIKAMDTAGAWLLHKYFPKAKFEHLSGQHKELMALVSDIKEEKHTEKKMPFLKGFFIQIGKSSCWAYDFTYSIFCFMGATFIRIFKNFAKPSHFRFPSIVRHIYETGVQALPIICLLSLGISMVITYQGAVQLKKFGADIFTIDLTVISLLREMAVLTTAIMVAGRSGSAFAAEIGVMKMRGEIDALQTMGFELIETLVLPRLLALMLTLPLLGFISDIVGLIGGGLIVKTKLGFSLIQYFSRVQTVATPRMFFIGIIKAPVFALLITAVSCYQGISVKGSAESAGKLTTLAVVQSIFLVIMADALFSILFSKVGM